MRRMHPSEAWCRGWVGLALLACLGAADVVRADVPMLAIRLAGGGSAIYPVSAVQYIGFENDTLVVVKPGAEDRYQAATVTRIEFLMEFSGVTDPRNAAALVKAVHLFQNQPNPFSPETRIVFELSQGGKVELGIYRPDGRLVRTLVTGERPAGRQEVRWDGLDDAGRRAAGGVYFYSLRAPGIADSRRMILLP
jgi:hypothetical protein